MDEDLRRMVRNALRTAGREFERARRSYRAGRDESAAEGFGLPLDEEGRARIVCRRHADRRAVAVDAAGRPACFEAGHPDCEGCAEDVREGVVETWSPDE